MRNETGNLFPDQRRTCNVPMTCILSNEVSPMATPEEQECLESMEIAREQGEVRAARVEQGRRGLGCKEKGKGSDQFQISTRKVR
jgi:hypothetical protein